MPYCWQQWFLMDLLDKSCNVAHIQECWHLALGLVQVTQPGEAVIWHIHTRLHTHNKKPQHKHMLCQGADRYTQHWSRTTVRAALMHL